jgi:hypothetical protein
VRLSNLSRSIISFLIVSPLAAVAVAAPGNKDNKEKPAAAQVVDSGSFGIFVKGQRVATETFNVEQRNGTSLIKSQVKETAGTDPSQKSELEITQTGELLRYEWSQASGGSLSVLPKNDFLIEKISATSSSKAAEQPFLMPSTSAILDNNFFIHREVLAWRYLAAACKPEGGNLKCQQGKAEFGALVPQDRNSIHLRLELVGREKVNFRGADRELMRLNLTGEDFEWALWLDEHDQFKLMKVAIPADSTEVVRD